MQDAVLLTALAVCSICRCPHACSPFQSLHSLAAYRIGFFSSSRSQYALVSEPGSQTMTANQETIGHSTRGVGVEPTAWPTVSGTGVRSPPGGRTTAAASSRVASITSRTARVRELLRLCILNLPSLWTES